MILSKKKIISLTLLSFLSFACKDKTPKTVSKDPKVRFATASDSCKAVIETTDLMRFQQKGIDLKELKISLSLCKKFYIHLKNVGKLPAKIMGHNFVLSKASDLPGLVKASMTAGKDKNYLPNDTRIIAKSNVLVGGGDQDKKEDYIEIDTNKLNKNDDYKFFCSFPGHYAIMQGKLKLL